MDMDNKCPSSTPSNSLIIKETSKQGKLLTPTSATMPTEENNGNETSSSSSSVASSLSSIPLKDLKRVLATQKTSKGTPTTTAKTKKKRLGTTKPNTKKPDQPKRKRNTTTVNPTTTTTTTKSTSKRNPRNNNNNNNNNNNKIKTPPANPTRSSQTSTVQKSDKLVLLNGDTIPDTNVVSPSKLSETNENSLTRQVKRDIEGPGDNDDSDHEEAACCLCHCGVDCSDRALFFPKDRKQELEEDEDYYFSMDDPFFPETLYDQNNALVYCDTCNRLYHQKCHFVPVLVIPRGNWNCLLCSLNKQPKTSSKQQPWRKFCDESLRQQIFTSPPLTSSSSSSSSSPPTLSINTKELQEEFERVTAIPKAQLWHRQLLQLRTFLRSQASNLRLATAALQTLTSTQRNRAHFSHSKKSQELAQTLVRLATAKWKIRSALLSLEDYRLRANALPSTLLDWIDTHSQYQSHVFPHGRELYVTHGRTIPRTQEMKQNPIPTTAKSTMSTTMNGSKRSCPNGSIPTEIAVPQPSSKSARSNSCNNSSRQYSPKANKKLKSIPVKGKGEYGIDDDSGISLDDLKCCVCLIGDATDENDVLLCDGEGCYRAFHMKCVFPTVTNIDDEDWFCPLCFAISNFLAEVQVACMDEDWEDRRMTEKFRHLDTSSLHSWAKAEEVFPEAEWEYATAMRLKEGKNDENTANLLRIYLGEDMVNDPMVGGGGPIGSDSEDENDYSLFDEKSFEERRQRERREHNNTNSKEHDDDDDDDESMSCSEASTRSSQATLVEMSSVELEIDKSELEALSDGGASSPLEDMSVGSDPSDPSAAAAGGHRRRSRRLRKPLNHNNSSSGRSATTDLDAELDESNIIEGKRKRKQVDYRRLNDALFGDLSPKERAKLDDVDDYHEVDKKTNKKGHNNKIQSNGKKNKKHTNGIKKSKKEHPTKSKSASTTSEPADSDENTSRGEDTIDQ